MTENEINFTATYIASIAKEDNAIAKVNIALQSLLSTYQKKVNVSMGKRNNFTPVTSIIKFTQKEISNMEKKFKKIWNING